MSAKGGTQVVMLRGINLGGRRRVPMETLRALLGEAGFGDVRTYLQSGNAVLTSRLAGDELEQRCNRLISEHFGFDVPVVARTAKDLRRVVAVNPLAGVAAEPKRYQVSFLAQPLPPERLASLERLAAGSERLVAVGRELYAWHPDGVARSKLGNALAASGLGVKATARNWSTVLALLELADAWV